MELIGKTRSVYERAAEPTLTIEPVKGKLKFNTSAIKATGLFGSSFAVAYDEENKAAYLYTDEENGIAMPNTGNVTARYHASRLFDMLTELEDADTVELNVASTGITFETYPGKFFYALTYDAPEAETEIVTEDAEEPIMMTAVELQEDAQKAFVADTQQAVAESQIPDTQAPAFNYQNANL